MDGVNYLLIATFLAGIVSGFLLFGIICIALEIVHGQRLKKQGSDKNSLAAGRERAKQHVESEKDNKRNKEITALLKEATNIVRIQADISDAIQQPSKNAPHSRYKNQLLDDYKELEKKKIAIFESILSKGYDPTVTVYNVDTQKTSDVKLSSLVESSKSKTNPIDDGPPESITKNVAVGTKITKKVKNGKTFFVIEKKEDDPTIH